MFNCKWQIRRIYAMTALSSLQFGGACWAALLAARGFLLTQIGLAETVFTWPVFCLKFLPVSLRMYSDESVL